MHFSSAWIVDHLKEPNQKKAPPPSSAPLPARGPKTTTTPGETTTRTTPKRELSSSVGRRQLRQAAGVAIASYALYHVLAMAYVITRLTAAANGPFGLTMAVNDALSEEYPFHTILLQKMVLMPIPNPGAKQYYESQRDFFLQAAQDFELHPYWSNYNQATLDMTFRQVVTERIRSMYRQYQESGRMDYRLEKDRCAQFDFLRRNHIRHPAILKSWYSLEQVLQDVQSGQAVVSAKNQDLDQQNWPLFFKACHLTQRSSLGTFAVSSPQAFVDKKQDLLTWIHDKWDYRSRDVDRPWQAEGDALTDELTPAIILQDPMMETMTSTPSSNWLSSAESSSPSSAPSTNATTATATATAPASQAAASSSSSSFALDGRIALGLVEIKAEVLWGKVYLMQIDGTTIFLRNGELQDYGTFMGGVLHRPGQAGRHHKASWIRDEGYLDCVIQTAERVAAAAHIDYIRVDIFLDRGNPAACAVNEVSLSSGYSYFGHEPYLAKLWAEPLHRKLYQRFGDYDTPVYELSS